MLSRSGLGMILVGVVALGGWGCEPFTTGLVLPIAAACEAHRICVYQEGEELSDRPADGEEEAAIRQWLRDGEGWRWWKSCVTYAPQTVIRCSSCNVNITGQVVVANVQRDGQWAQYARDAAQADRQLAAFLRERTAPK